MGMNRGIDSYEGDVGWYVVKAVEVAGESDIEGIEREFDRLTKRDGKKIIATERYTKPKKYYGGYISWAKGEGFLP